MKPISSGRVAPVGINPLGGADPQTNGAQRTAGQLAGNVAGTIARALHLGVDPDGRHRSFTPAQDGYDVEAAADALAEQLGATPAERGEIARSLHAFVSEVAASLGATPDSRALTQIADIVSAMDASSDAKSAVRCIEQATDRLAGRTGR